MKTDTLTIWKKSTWNVGENAKPEEAATYMAQIGQRMVTIELTVLGSIFLALVQGAGAHLAEGWMKALAIVSVAAGLGLFFCLIQGLDRLAVVRLKQSGLWSKRNAKPDAAAFLVRGIMWLDLAKRGFYLQIVCVMAVAIAAGVL